MATTVLIIAKKEDVFLANVEAALLTKGFQTLTVRSAATAFDRLRAEHFVAIIIDPNALSEPQSTLRQLAEHPLLAVTPFVLIEPTKTAATHPFSEYKTLHDQIFWRDELLPDAVADYLVETVRETAKGAKLADLQRVGFAKLLYSVHQVGFTGSIIVEQESERRTVYLNEGEITFASSSSAHDSFGECLLRQNLVSAEQVRQALDWGKEKGVRIGTALVQLQIMKPDKLFPLLENQVRQILKQLFTWSSGSYAIVPKQAPNPEEGIFKIAVPPLIHEGIKEVANEALINRNFRSLDAILVPHPHLQERLAEFKFSAPERQLIKTLNAPVSLLELTRRSHLSSLESLRLCLTLISTQWCKLEHPQETPKKSTPPSVPTGAPLKPPTPLPMAQRMAQVYAQHEPLKPAIAPTSQAQGRSYFAGLQTGVALGIFLAAGAYTSWKQFIVKEQTIETISTVQAAATATPTVHAVPAVSLAAAALAENAPPVVVKAAVSLPVKVSSVPPPKPIDPQTQFRELTVKADAYYKSGDFDKAKAHYTKALNLKPTSTATLISLANLHYDNDLESDALWYIKRVLQIDAYNPDAHLVLGGIYLMKSQTQEAIAEYQMFLKYCQDEKRKEEVRKVLVKLGVEG